MDGKPFQNTLYYGDNLDALVKAQRTQRGGRSMKSLRTVSFFMLSVLAICCLGCVKKAEKEKADKSSYDALMADIRKPDVEKVALLSIKYSIEANKLEKLLEAYEGNPFSGKLDLDDLMKEWERPYLERINDYIEKIIKISNDFGLPKEIVAKIIIEYNVWEEAGREQ